MMIQAKKLIVCVSALIVCGIIFVFIFRFRDHNPLQKKTVFIMGTYCSIQIPGSKDVLKNIESAFERMKKIEAKFTVFDKESPVYIFNQTDAPLDDEEIIGLIKTSLKVSRETGGAFDITIYPLMKLWGHYGEKRVKPSPEKINACLELIGHENLIIREGRVSKRRPHAGIDFGGIAKGYAVREAAAILRKQGIESALIDAGGDIFAMGTIDGKNWKIGIRNPRGEGIIGVLDVSNQAVVTSGDYEQYFEEDGKKYHHILDPRTGYPAQKLISVTVISPDPVLADAWSTALFVIGGKQGLELVEKTDDLEAVIITREEKIMYSSGLDGIFTPH